MLNNQYLHAKMGDYPLTDVTIFGERITKFSAQQDITGAGGSFPGLPWDTPA